MTDRTATVARHSRTGQHAAATQNPRAQGSPGRKQTRMKSLLSSQPVLWFLFLFNLVVAVAAGAGGHHIHLDGHTLHGTQQIMTAAGMGAVAIGAGAALYLRRRQQS